ncbi:MAG: amino acid ABC transporter permease, partial [Candidatus Micrarchaeaceae archaeon]
MNSIWGWFRTLHETTGINLTILYDPFDRQRFASGLLMTFRLSAISILASVIIGVVGAWLQGSR